MSKKNKIVFIIIIAGLHLLRYNLFGVFDTWEWFYRLDLLSWLLTNILLFKLYDSRFAKSVALFLICINLGAVINSYYHLYKWNYTELIVIVIALILSAYYCYKDQVDALFKRGITSIFRNINTIAGKLWKTLVLIRNKLSMLKKRKDRTT